MARGQSRAQSETPRRSLADRIGGFQAPDEGATAPRSRIADLIGGSPAPVEGEPNISEAAKKYVSWEDEAISTKGMLNFISDDFRGRPGVQEALQGPSVQLRLMAMKEAIQEFAKNAEELSPMIGKPPPVTIRSKPFRINGEGYQLVYVDKPLKFEGKWTFDSFDESLIKVRPTKRG